MLEKIGLPPKPSLRGNAWVVDASHCQGCSTQFSFIHRKHHCRRCGGIFCSTCTQQKMFLRGQGDSPVRICDPCKKLEDAARFELRSGNKNRAGKGNSVINQVLGNEGSESFSGSTSSIVEEVSAHGDESDNLHSEAAGSVTPEALRQQALEEKNKYKILKGKGKSEDALKAFKRGKELERQADALEISLRKNKKRALSATSSGEILNNSGSGRKNKLSAHVVGEKDEFTAELRELGLTDMDIHEDKKSANVSIEGELFNILGEVSQKSNKSTGHHGIDKSEVLAIKKKALALKREGNLAEAKEELKKAKILEKQLEEQELLDGADDNSDDELSALINNMDDDNKDDFQLNMYEREPNLDIDNLMGISDDITSDNNFEVTDNDLHDPTMAAALASLGWDDDSDPHMDKEARASEILSLKKEALIKKREGNTTEAMDLLKKAKLLERESESFDSPPNVRKDSTSKVAPKSRLTIQRELIALKKKALTLKREGKSDEAEEELRKGRALEQQLEEIDNGPKVKAAGADLAFENPAISDDLPVEEDVTDQDMHDPTYLSLLSNLGWNDESSAAQAVSDLPARKKSRSKAEVQRELLGLKRKSLALRRQGQIDEADEILQQTKALEAEMAEIEAPKVPVSSLPKDNFVEPPLRMAVRKDENEDVTEADINDPALLSVLKGFGFEDEEQPPKQVTGSERPVKKQRTKGEIQRELLGLKRKALAHRRKGEIEEADEVSKMANVLEAEIEELEAPSKEVLPNPESSAEAVDKSPMVVEPLLSSAPVESETGKNISSSLVTSYLDKNSPPLSTKQAFSGETQSAQGVFSTTAAQSGNIVDLPTEKREKFDKVDTGHSTIASSTQPQGLDLQTEQNSLRQEILARKRKAIKLKREGNLAEAIEELRQAKLLEKNLGEDNTQSKTDLSGVSPSSNTHPIPEKEQKGIPEKEQKGIPEKEQKGIPKVTPKLLSSHDRFKIQQQSLGHKRNAMKLRREGRVDEAEAEFEMAKTLEAQLDSAAQDSAKSSAGATGDLGVDDFLDPQLLSALQAIGIADASSMPSQQRPVETVTRVASKVENINPEKKQLEEQMKAEKIKAVTLKRSGKQAEALEALRRAKAYEKKLNLLG
ncbi:hypothetical protein ACFE04_000230 [Oxalis oulophora]